MVEAFFTSGHVADFVLAVMALETVALFILMQRGRINLPFRTYLLGVVAGSFIVIGLRIALTSGSWTFIALALVCSFAAHIGEVFMFVRRSNGNPNYRDPSYKYRSETRTGSKKGLEQ